jgi:hypothetical protein
LKLPFRTNAFPAGSYKSSFLFCDKMSLVPSSPKPAVSRDTKKHIMKCVNAVICNPTADSTDDIEEVVFELQELVKAYPHNKTFAEVHKIFRNVRTLIQEAYENDELEHEIAAMAERGFALFLTAV